MLFHVDTKVSIERGREIEKAGGPGPAFAHLVERFRPQQFYFSAMERRTFMIVELDTPAKIAELMLVGTNLCGTEPQFTIVAPVQDGAKIIGEAMQNAAKAPKIG